MILQRADHHTRHVWTELVCKSFRNLRGEPKCAARPYYARRKATPPRFYLASLRTLLLSRRLFDVLRLHDRTRGDGLFTLINRKESHSEGRTLGPLRVRAEHWSNAVALRSHCLTALDLSAGNAKAPLTALKAMIRAAPPTLRSLNLSTCNTINALTIKEIGSHLKGLHALNLNAGRLEGLGVDGEEAMIQMAAQMPHLRLLRVPPFSAFGSFLGDWCDPSRAVSLNHHAHSFSRKAA